MQEVFGWSSPLSGETNSLHSQSTVIATPPDHLIHHISSPRKQEEEDARYSLMHIADGPSFIAAPAPYWGNLARSKTTGPRVGEYAHVGRLDSVSAPKGREEMGPMRARTYDARIPYRRAPARQHSGTGVEKGTAARQPGKIVIKPRSSFKTNPVRRKTTLARSTNQPISSSPSIQSLIESVISEAPSRTPSEKRALNKFTTELRAYLEEQQTMPEEVLSRASSMASATTEVTVNTVQALKPWHEEFRAAGLAVTGSEQRMKKWMEKGRTLPTLPIEKKVEMREPVKMSASNEKILRSVPVPETKPEEVIPQPSSPSVNKSPTGDIATKPAIYSKEEEKFVKSLTAEPDSLPQISAAAPGPGKAEAGAAANTLKKIGRAEPNDDKGKRIADIHRSQTEPVRLSPEVVDRPPIPPRSPARKTLAWIRRPEINSRASSVLKTKSSNVQARPSPNLATARSQSPAKSQPQMESITEPFPLFDPTITPRVEMTASSSPLIPPTSQVTTGSSSPVIYFDTQHEPWEAVARQDATATPSPLKISKHEAVNPTIAVTWADKRARQDETGGINKKQEESALEPTIVKAPQKKTHTYEAVPRQSASALLSDATSAPMYKPSHRPAVSKTANAVVAQLSSIFDKAGDKSDKKSIKIPSQLLKNGASEIAERASPTIQKPELQAPNVNEPTALMYKQDSSVKPISVPQKSELSTIAVIKRPSILAASIKEPSSTRTLSLQQVRGRASPSIGIPRHCDTICPFSPPSRYASPEPESRMDMLQPSTPTLKRVRAHKCTRPSLFEDIQSLPKRVVSMKASIEGPEPRPLTTPEFSANSTYFDMATDVGAKTEDLAAKAMLDPSPIADPMKKHSPPPSNRPPSGSSTPTLKASSPKSKPKSRKQSKPRFPTYPSTISLSPSTTTASFPSSASTASTTTQLFLGLHVASAAACDPDLDTFIKDVTGLEVRQFLRDISVFEGASIDSLRKVARRAGREERRRLGGWERKARMKKEEGGGG